MQKKILILGGTQFIGRSIVERLQSYPGFELTLFNRGKTQGHLFPDLHKLKGDRETDDVHQLAGKDWDLVIDVSSYYPDSLRKILAVLPSGVKKYILISTCSVYDMDIETEQADTGGSTVNPKSSLGNGDRDKDREISVEGLKNEDSPILSCSVAEERDRTDKTYGQRKAQCDRILASSGMNHVILRPALVYGPYDHTDRLYYWLHQVRHKPTLLLPDQGERKFSLTFVDDLVDTVVHTLFHQTPSSIYNIISNPEISIRQIVDTAKAVLNRTPQELNASPEFLKAEGIRQWVDMPLWIDGDHYTYDNQRMCEELGMVPTELAEGIRRTVEYASEQSWPAPTFGMSEEIRRSLLGKLSGAERE